MRAKERKEEVLANGVIVREFFSERAEVEQILEEWAMRTSGKSSLDEKSSSCKGSEPLPVRGRAGSTGWLDTCVIVRLRCRDRQGQSRGPLWGLLTFTLRDMWSQPTVLTKGIPGGVLTVNCSLSDWGKMTYQIHLSWFPRCGGGNFWHWPWVTLAYCHCWDSLISNNGVSALP